MDVTRIAPGAELAGRFRLERLLGQGGMGEVWEATQLALGRRVAVKIIRPELSHDGDAVRRFGQETAAIARVQHGCVVQVFDGGADPNGLLYLVMELVGGETLRQRLERGAVPVPLALDIGVDIASALVATHGAGVLHRDLKCENVMVRDVPSEGTRAKVLDFGISRLAHADHVGHTPTGVIVGTPGYVAPEQMLGNPVDARADLYALGVILFECIVGAPPFVADAGVQLLMQHLTTPAPRLASAAQARGVTVSSGLDALVASLLAKDPADRPTDAAALLAALRTLRESVTTSESPRASAAAPTPAVSFATETMSGFTPAPARPLFGRERELQELIAGAEAASAGRGSLFFLVGEPGIGKTRLSDAFAEQCTRRGIDVAWGRAWEAGGAPAFHPWVEALDALVESNVELPVEELAWLQEIAPAARGRAPPPPTLDPSDARFRVFGAVASLLKRASERRPLALILDDLHAADAGSLQLLLAVARDLRRRRVVIIGTWRDVEAHLVPEVGELLGRLSREGRTLPLARLRVDDVGLLVRSHARREIKPAVRDAIFQATHGNPLFVDEMVRLLAAEDRLDDVGGGPLPIPLGVREAIRQRLGRAEGDVRRALEVIALLGREVRSATAAAVHGGPIDDAVREGVRFGVLMRPERDIVRFTHALYREELVAELPAERARELHLRAADVLGASHSPPLLDVAVHLLDAGPTQATRAADAALLAAAQLLDALAFEDAASLAQRVLEDLPSLDDRRRGDLYVLLGRAVMLSGDVKRAHELCLRAAETARQSGDAELLARAALGYGARVVEAHVDRTLVSLLQEALAALGPRSSLWRPRVMARLASAQQPALDHEGPMVLAREAIALARDVGDKRTLLAALHDGMGALMSFAAPRERMSLNSQALQLADELGDASKVLRARFRLAMDALEDADLPAFDRTVDEYESYGRSLRSRDAAWRGPLLRAAVAEGRGQAELAARLLGEAEAAEAPESVLILHRFLSARVLGHPIEGDGLERALAAMHGGVYAHLPPTFEAVQAADRFDREATRRALARLDLQRVPMFTLLWLSDAISLVGEAGAAARGLDMLVTPHRLMLETMSFTLESPVGLVRTLFLDVCGRSHEAEEAAAAVVDEVRALGLHGYLARSALHAARLWASRDPARAAAFLDEGRAAITPQTRAVHSPLLQRAEHAVRGSDPAAG